MCEPGYVKWIHSAFDDCIVTPRDMISFAVGLLSNFLWIVSAAPQITKNFRMKKVEGQSPCFFGFLLLGDILSLAGILLAGGIATQIITQSLYVFLDGVMFLQYLYYNYVRRKIKEDDLTAKTEEEIIEFTPDSSGPSYTGLLTALMVNTVSAACDYSAPYKGKELIGTIFGWLGCIEYCTSGSPQIRKNHARKKVSNISPIYIAFVIGGNGTYVLAVVIRSLDPSFLWQQAPWIIGSLGPMISDSIIAIQMCIYGVDKDECKEDTEAITA